MNEIFSFHKELNIKKIVIAVVLCVIFLFGIIYVFVPKNETLTPIKEKIVSKTKTYYSDNKDVSLILSKSFNLTQKKSPNHLIKLGNDENLNILISKHDLIEDQELIKVVEKDKDNYSKNFDLRSNQSLLIDFDFEGTTGYSYSFHYLDSDNKTPYYLQVFWIQKDNYYYVVDLEFPLEKLEDYSSIVNEILTNLSV